MEEMIPWSRCLIHQIIQLLRSNSAASCSCWRCFQFFDMGRRSLHTPLHLWRVSAKNYHFEVLTQLFSALRNALSKGTRGSFWACSAFHILARTNAECDLDPACINKAHPNSRIYFHVPTFSSAGHCSHQVITCTLSSWLCSHTKVLLPLHSSIVHRGSFLQSHPNSLRPLYSPVEISGLQLDSSSLFYPWSSYWTPEVAKSTGESEFSILFGHKILDCRMINIDCYCWPYQISLKLVHCKDHTQHFFFRGRVVLLGVV